MAGIDVGDLAAQPGGVVTSIADKIVAESLLNRLVGGSESVSLDGPGMTLSSTVIR